MRLQGALDRAKEARPVWFDHSYRNDLREALTSDLNQTTASVSCRSLCVSGGVAGTSLNEASNRLLFDSPLNQA